MKDVEIIYRDSDMIICRKPCGVICEDNGENQNIIALLKEKLEKEYKQKAYVGLVHRLDAVTEGLMLFSANPKMTGKLSESIMNKTATKEYLAIVHGHPEESEGEMRDLLFRDPQKNKSFVVKRSRRGVKEAILSYKLLETVDSKYGEISLIQIKLITGRTHQIRVQFSSRGMPLLGDGKYGAKDNAPNVALLSRKLTLPHPTSKKLMKFEISPSNNEPWGLFDIYN